MSVYAAVDCPETVATIINNAGMQGSTPLTATAPNGQAMQVYQNVNENVKVEASATGGEWSWIIITNGNPNRGTKDPSYHDIQLTFKGCKVSTVVSNHARRDSAAEVSIDQATAGAQFCRNLNNGLTPMPLEQEYLQFSDGDGNILASRLDDTKAMCKRVANILQ